MDEVEQKEQFRVVGLIAGLWPRSLLARLLSVVCYVVVGGNIAILTVLHNQSAATVERTESVRLRSIVVPLAQQIDGDLHEAVARQYPGVGEITDWSIANAEAQYLRQQLSEVARKLRIETPIVTIRMKPAEIDRVRAAFHQTHPGAYQQILTTADDVKWRMPVDYAERMARSQFITMTYASGVYSDENGRWISAFSPIMDSGGNVVALLRVNARVDKLFEEVRLQTIQQASLIGFIVVVMLLGIAYVTERLGRDLNTIERAAEHLGRGNLTKRIRVLGGPEVQRLAASLELARKRLQKNSVIIDRVRKDFEKRLALVNVGFEFEGGGRRAKISEELTEMAFSIQGGNAKPVGAGIIDMVGPRWSFRVVDPAVKLWIPGMETNIRVAATLRRPEVFLGAKLESMHASSEGMLVHLLLVEDRFEDFLSSAMVRLLDRRENIRVISNRHDNPKCTLLIHLTGERHEAEVIDLCRTGVGVKIELDIKKVSRWGPGLYAVIRLPGGISEKIPSTVKYLRELDGSLRLGLEFDDDFLRDTGTPGLLRYITSEERLQR